MSRALPFTQAGVLRAIRAVEKAGLRVAGVRPDGTVIVDNGQIGLAPAEMDAPNRTPSKWEDVQA